MLQLFSQLVVIECQCIKKQGLEFEFYLLKATQLKVPHLHL